MFRMGRNVFSVRLPQFSTCFHEPEVYQQCFLAWLQRQIESIDCPSSRCSNPIVYEDVLNYNPEDVFTW